MGWCAPNSLTPSRQRLASIVDHDAFVFLFYHRWYTFLILLDKYSNRAGSFPYIFFDLWKTLFTETIREDSEEIESEPSDQRKLVFRMLSLETAASATGERKTLDCIRSRLALVPHETTSGFTVCT
jgi:hypothetical protein